MRSTECRSSLIIILLSSYTGQSNRLGVQQGGGESATGIEPRTSPSARHFDYRV